MLEKVSWRIWGNERKRPNTGWRNSWNDYLKISSSSAKWKNLRTRC